MPDAVLTAAGLAARAEVAWRGPDGQLHLAAVVPHALRGAVVVALPFSRSALARALRRTATATVALTDSRMAWKGWRPLTVPVSVDVAADRAGDWTWTGLLDAEVRKHPPSRLLIDTPIQRREHWWYVPRWIVTLTPVGSARPVARRADPDDGVLCEADGAGGIAVRPVAVDDWDADVVAVTDLDGGAWPPGPAPALLATHDFSIPDQERGSLLQLSGMRRGNRLEVVARSGSRALEPLGGVLRRIGRQRRLERACRRGIADYDASVRVAT